MSQPTARLIDVAPPGDPDASRGEFWISNAWRVPSTDRNLSAYEPNQVFLNISRTRFAEIGHLTTANSDGDGRGVMVADINGDLQPDLLVRHSGGGPLRVAWQPKQTAEGADGLVQLESYTSVHVSDPGVHLRGHYRFRVRQGGLPEVAFELPASVRVQTVTGADVGGWDVEANDQSRRLRVFFRRRIDDETVVRVELFQDRRVGDRPTELVIESLGVMGFDRDKGQLAVFVDDQFTVRAAANSNLRQTDVAQSTRPSWCGKPEARGNSKVVMPPQLLYGYITRPFGLTLRLTRRTARATVVARHGVTTLGISPTAVRLLRSAGDEWVDKHDLSGLRILGSTGEPWDPESYMWFFEKVGGGRCPVINCSGGTELVGCLLSPLPVLPSKACSLGGPALGKDVDVYDDEGRPVRGGIGHLVCKKPFPSMTKGFLNDPDRYLETYFSRWPGVWYHGDWAMVDDDGYWYLYGRSDDTIMVAGKRVGPAEVESALLRNPAVMEAAAIGVPHDLKGEAVVAFAVLSPDAEPTEALRSALVQGVVDVLGKALVPDAVLFVDAIPKTRSAKILRGSIRRAYLGESVGDISSVENPQAFEAIADAR